jgi:hypothetical protein
MLFVRILIWMLEFAFFAGLIGSAVVVILTGFDDVKEISEKHKAKEKEVGSDYVTAMRKLSDHPA